MKRKVLFGHINALATTVIWGTTYISTKVLLADFSPVEILLTRFVMGYIFLWILHPHRLNNKSVKKEILFALAGFTGMTLYYLLENIALTYTMASNVGIIISAAPFLTMIAAKLILRDRTKLGFGFYLGFVIAMAGITLISLNGAKLSFNPKGDVLAFLAAAAWAVYSVFSKKIGDFGYNIIGCTRRIFFWGIVFIAPAAFVFDFSPDYNKFLQVENILNLVYLGLVASSLCYISWNYAIKTLGAVKTNVYIYLTPVVTVVTSLIFLGERFTWMSALGTCLALAGLVLSQNIKRKKVKNN